VRVQDRHTLQTHLTDAGIGTGIHYPVPLHVQKAYAHLNYREGDFPVTESATQRILSLPMSTSLTSEQQAIVVESIVRVCSEICAGVSR